jgi:hypothetical protein
MTWRHCGVSGLVIVLVAGIVSALVYSVDPIWVAGAYDDGDYDATALAVSSPEGLVGPLPPLTAPPLRSTFLGGSEIPRGTSAAEPRGTLATRAPPPA